VTGIESPDLPMLFKRLLFVDGSSQMISADFLDFEDRLTTSMAGPVYRPICGDKFGLSRDGWSRL
jgi:hypothetical protein